MATNRDWMLEDQASSAEKRLTDYRKIGRAEIRHSLSPILDQQESYKKTKSAFHVQKSSLDHLLFKEALFQKAEVASGV